VNMIEAVKSFYGNYVNFAGRSPRSAYWWWVLFYVIIAVIIAMVEGGGHGGGMPGGGFSYNYSGGPIAIVWSLVNLIPGIALGVRRLHDIDKSGWWLLIGLIPLVGAIILLVWFATRGTAGPNRFGPDPLAGGPIA